LILATVATALSLLAPAAQPTLIAAGDIASCSSSGDERTAALVARIPGTVAVLGDAVYESGTAQEFRDCYSWGRFRGRTRAALGNHEYGSGTAAAAIAYFRLPRSGYYSYDLGDWHVAVLNSNCRAAGGCERGSPQQRWLAADLAANPALCTVAYMHHPRFSSGLHGSDTTLGALWTTLSRGGADVVLAGHDHHYERFAPFEGIRAFVVGSGGRSHYPVLWRLSRPKSVALDDDTYGVLKLTLGAEGYDWRFVPVAGSTYSDSGSSSCH
jgi:acid phosphatase type 7